MIRDGAVRAEMMLPDVVEKYPATRGVFDKYGLKGCGGQSGPSEAVEWFARLHGVPLEKLLGELNEAAESGDQSRPAFRPSIADTIYRPFFIAALLTVFTLGCMWGAINLLTIGTHKDFGSVSYSWVLAHAHAMVFGFVGLFIMGFAYQAFPRFKHTSLWRPRLAFSALPLMILGIGLQTIAHLRAPQDPFLLLGVAGGLVQFIAVAVFTISIVATMRRAKKPETYDSFVYAALGWFLIAAIANPIIFWHFEGAADEMQFVMNIATYNIPYRDVQLAGVAVVMILGVSLRFLPHAYALSEPSREGRNFLLWGTNGAILLGVTSFLARRLTGNEWLAFPQELAAFTLFVVAIGSVGQFHLFDAMPESERDRGLKFIRAAFVWFIVATLMLALAPVYNSGIYAPLTGSEIPFSHAYFGAYRHALTVGFIMMMIVGVSSKVVPTLSGVDVRRASTLAPTFLLLNLGNALRVSTEIATDFTPSAYSVMGVSGFIEVLGLSLWGYELISNMREGKRLQRKASDGKTGHAFTITPQTKVAEVLERYPQSLGIFLHHGFTPLANPVLRRTMARAISLEQACRREGVALDELLGELHKATSAEQSAPVKITPRVNSEKPALN
ncbi:MAG: DUF1858 domain-containing protein [Acidobacteriota bacterium]|nr:DUF1858 domain-containing protein [Acidobacteriota bacterium]